MKMNDWTKMLKGDMSGLKQQKKEVIVPEGKIYRLQWANKQKTNLIDHDTTVKKINEWLNKFNWNWLKVINEETKQTQVIYEPKSKNNRGFLHIKKLNENMLVESVTQNYSNDIKKYKPLAKKN